MRREPTSGVMAAEEVELRVDAVRLAALLREAIGSGEHESCPLCGDATECRGIQALREYEDL